LNWRPVIGIREGIGEFVARRGGTQQ